MRVRLRLRVRGVCMWDGPVDDPDSSPTEGEVEGRVDPESEGPAGDSGGPADNPEMGVMGERSKPSGEVQESSSSSDLVTPSSGSSPDSSLETKYSDKVGEGLRRWSSSLAVTASPTQKIIHPKGGL